MCSTSVLPLRERGVGGGTGHSPFKVRHHPVDALKSGCCIRSAQTRAPARGVQQLAAVFATKLPMVSPLVPDTAAAPAMRERCMRTCWGCTVLILRSRAWTCCGKHQQACLPCAIESRCTCKAAQLAFFTGHTRGAAARVVAQRGRLCCAASHMASVCAAAAAPVRERPEGGQGGQL